MLEAGGDPRGTAGQTIWTERRGFDLVAAGDHAFFHGPAASASVTLAAAAAGLTGRAADPGPGR